jgi:uncharacterized Zn-finger protein
MEHYETPKRKKIEMGFTVPVVIIIIFVVAIILGVTIVINGNNLSKRNADLKKQVNKLEYQSKQFQMKISEQLTVISAGVSFDQKRKRLLLKLRDIIVNDSIELTEAKAYAIAENNLDFCDRYKRVDVILLTAIQQVESSFKSNAVSKQGATGLNQIWPSTGRMLCKFLGWEYDPEILLDLEKNTYLACSYLDILYVTYKGQIPLMLAEYNGGPRNARYFKNGDPKLSTETCKYVEKVMLTFNRYSKKITEVL